MSELHVAAGCYNSATLAEKAGDERGALIELTMAAAEFGFTPSTVRHETLDGLFELVREEIAAKAERLVVEAPRLHERAS